MPSPAVTSPFAPASFNAAFDAPPIDVRLTVTFIGTVLSGFVPRATVARSKVLCVAATDAGVALAAVIDGGVDEPVTVTVTGISFVAGFGEVPSLSMQRYAV